MLSHDMKALLKIGIVAAGFFGAILLVSVVVAIGVAYRNPVDEQASSGMYALGDGLMFVAVFGIAGLVPTAAALYFLRPSRRTESRA